MEKKQRQIRSVWKKMLRRGAMGVGIGNLISMTIALIMGSAMKSPQMTIYDYARYTCASSAIGFAFAAACLLFECEKISLLKATAIHFVCLIAVFYPCALLAGWYSFQWKELLVSVAIFAGCYVCIWLGLYIGIKRQAKKLNADLDANRNARS